MKNIKLILFAFLAFSMVTSCIVDDEPDTSLAEGPYVVGFVKKTANITFFADEGVVLRNYPVKILGGSDGSSTTQDIVINYTVDGSSTATEGQEFDFVTNSGTLVIPAGQTFAQFPLNINTGGFDANMPTTLVLKLSSTNAAGAVVSSRNNTLTIKFVGCQSQINGNYSNPDVPGPALVTITPNTAIESTVSGLPYLGTSGGTVPVPFTITDICGQLSIGGTVLNGGYALSGTAVLNADGSITVAYLLEGPGGPFDFTDQPSTYVPN